MNRKLVIAAFAFGLLQLTGCASPLDLQIFTSVNLTPATLETSPYVLQAMGPTPGTYRHLRVYIEGDGHARANSSQPSTDPTPRTSLMLKYASEDGNSAVYLARPCHFVMSSICNVGNWTDHRFARHVMDAVNASLDLLKIKFRVEHFELVGHSGGAKVAQVLAGMRADMVQMHAIAGNINPVFRAQLHNLSPLIDPITPTSIQGPS